MSCILGGRTQCQKKVYKQVLNLNWEILTKNLVTLKRWDGVMDEKFYYYESLLKRPICWGEGFTKNQYIGDELPKKGSLDRL